MREMQQLLKWLGPLIILEFIAQFGRLDTLDTTLNVVNGTMTQMLLQKVAFPALIVSLQNIVSWLIEIVICIWLFSIAARNDASRWLWALFGLSFGTGAIAIFYLVQLSDRLVTRGESLDGG